jgi:hypothetical protein
MRRAAYRLGAGWIDRLTCAECKESIPAPGKRKAKAPPPPPAPLPAGELAARAGNLDASTAQTVDALETVVDRAVAISNQLLEGTWGPVAMPLGRRLAISRVAAEALATLSEETIALVSARIAVEDEPAAPWVGWTRQKGQRWRAVVHGQTEAETLDALLNATEGGDKMTLPSGRHPDDVARARR